MFSSSSLLRSFLPFTSPSVLEERRTRDDLSAAQYGLPLRSLRSRIIYIQTFLTRHPMIAALRRLDAQEGRFLTTVLRPLLVSLVTGTPTATRLSSYTQCSSHLMLTNYNAQLCPKTAFHTPSTSAPVKSGRRYTLHVNGASHAHVNGLPLRLLARTPGQLLHSGSVFLSITSPSILVRNLHRHLYPHRCPMWVP